jgi:hypothetical protein
MQTRDWILPGLALGGALLAFAPARGLSWNLTGDQLDLRQLDFRVFNNFTDPEANDYTGVHPDFPGATGAVLAIWKGVVEWGSELHGTGHGDPGQPGDLGSGGANFDPSFQGEAIDVGSTDANIFSELHAFGGGTVAFIETPTSNGWRARFYMDPKTWDDDPIRPRTQGSGFDLQGTTAHEYGHALGLAHSAVPGATMETNLSDFGVPLRSIEEDDRLGVQAIYGQRDANKPHVGGYVLLDRASGLIEIEGSHFDPLDNQVWFTRAVPIANVEDGSPVLVEGLASTSGGTRLQLTIPPAGGPGDLLVKVPGTTNASLSNAFPFDPQREPCIAPVLYGTAKTTSIGSLPELSFAGLASLRLGSFTISTGGGVNQESGILFSGRGRSALPFQGGTLWVAGPHRREQLFSFFLGFVELEVPIDATMVGSTRNYQLWFQDPGDPRGVGLSNALEVTFCE